MDETDIKIIKMLQKNARTSYREISSKLGLSPTTISERVKRMFEAGVFEGFYPRLDYKELGFMVDLLILWEADVSKVEEVEEFNGEMQRESYDPEKDQEVVVHYVWSGTIPPFTAGMICSARTPEGFREWWYRKIKKYAGLIRHFDIVLVLKKFEKKKGTFK